MGGGAVTSYKQQPIQKSFGCEGAKDELQPVALHIIPRMDFVDTFSVEAKQTNPKSAQQDKTEPEQNFIPDTRHAGKPVGYKGTLFLLLYLYNYCV